MKKFRKLLVLIASLCMVFGMALTANADTASSIKLQKLSTGKTVTTYVNGAEQAYFTITYQWEAKGPVYQQYGTDNAWVPSFRVVSANGAIARYDKVEAVKTTQVTKKKGKKSIPVEGTYTTTAKVYLKDANVGKVKFTVSLYGSNVKAVSTTITLKSYANDVVVGAADEDNVISVANGSTIPFNAYAAFDSAKASNSGVTYSVTSGAANVKIKSGKVTGKALGETTVVVTSSDKKANKTITVKVVPAKVTDVKVVDANNKKVQKTNITLSTGDKADNKTAELFLAGDFDSLSQLKFTSSNSGVAKVDENGKITAVKNGTATIKVAPALGNNTKKNVVEVKVTVSTAVETLDWTQLPYRVLDNKKAQKIGAAVNATASNKSVKYEIVKITDGDTVVLKKNWSKYAKVDSKKATITGYQACTVEIKASAGKLSIVDTVYVSKQCPDIKFSYKSGKKTKTTNALTKTVVFAGLFDNEEGMSLDAPQTFNLYTDLNLNPAIKDAGVNMGFDYGTGDIDWETGDVTIYPDGNSTTRLVIQAGDGSGKKATVTFKKDTRVSSFDIFGNSWDPETDSPEIVIKAGTKTDVTKLIQTNVNYSASNKGVTITSNTKIGGKKVKLTALKLNVGQEVDVTVTTKGTDINGKTLSKNIKVRAIAATEVATEVDLDVTMNVSAHYDNVLGDITEYEYVEDASGKTFYMYAEDSMYTNTNVYPAFVADEDGEGIHPSGTIVDPGVSYKFSDNGAKAQTSSKIIKIASDGRITALKSGTVDVTVASKQVPATTVTYKIIVAKKQSDVEAKYFNLFASTLAEENTSASYGIKATFDKKNAFLNLEIVNPEMSVSEWQGNNGRSVFARPEFANISNIYVTNGMYDEETDAEHIVKEMSRTEISNLDFFGTYGDTILASYVGEYAPVTLKVVEYTDGHPFEYAIHIAAKTTVSDATTKTYLNNQFEKLVDMAKEDALYNEDEAIVTFNKATGTLTVEIVDKDYDLKSHVENIKTVYNNLYDRVYAADGDKNIQFVLDKVKYVSGFFETAGGIATEFERTEIQQRDKSNIDEIFTEERINKLTGKTLSDLDGATAKVSASGEAGGTVSEWMYFWGTYSITVNFRVSASAFDNAKDVEITDALAVSDILTYDGTKNELTVSLDENFTTLGDLEGHGLGTVFDAIKGDAKTVQVISAYGVITKLSDTAITKDAIAKAVFIEPNKTAVLDTAPVAALAGKTATIKTTFANGYTFVYTVAFDVTIPDISGGDADVKNDPVEIIDEIIEEETEETEEEESEDVSEND